MNIFEKIENIVEQTLQEMPFWYESENLPPINIKLEAPRDKTHGDLSSNIAMILAKTIGKTPKDFAAEICCHLAGAEFIQSATVAGPGFINLKLKSDVWFECVKCILQMGEDFGSSDFGKNEVINVEYVSANPTGPLHAAHARGAVVGDTLARLLKKVGFRVCKEYYVNDAGTQVDILAKSTHLRYLEALGHEIGPIPDGLYPGEYLKEVGAALAQKTGDIWVTAPEEEWLPVIRDFTTQWLMRSIKSDLSSLGIVMDEYISERSLVAAGEVDNAMNLLKEKKLIYKGVLQPPKGKQSGDWEPRPQLLFKSTDFGDDVDRAIQKSDGSWTYFASDVAYHVNKVKRGYLKMIDVWGADHGGYVRRMQAAVNAASNYKANLDVKICQIVHLLKNGKPFRMSKRDGTFITLEDVLKVIGKDVTRFMMLTRRNDQVLEFDFDTVVAQSRDNPVFYVQYAHARCCSVMRHASKLFGNKRLTADSLTYSQFEQLGDEAEMDVIKELASWPRIVEGAAQAHEPHRIAFYLTNLAGSFHSLWNKGKDHSELRFIIEDNEDLTFARLALIQAIILVLASGLELIGIEPIQEMKS